MEQATAIAMMIFALLIGLVLGNILESKRCGKTSPKKDDEQLREEEEIKKRKEIKEEFEYVNKAFHEGFVGLNKASIELMEQLELAKKKTKQPQPTNTDLINAIHSQIEDVCKCDMIQFVKNVPDIINKGGHIIVDIDVINKATKYTIKE